MKSFRVVAVTGPRQVGKSTLLRRERPTAGFRYLDLDDLELRSRVEHDPHLPWRDSDTVVVDEAHRVPALLTALKSEVDRRRELRVVISGSANLLLMRDIAESLAGRATYLDLLPFAIGEWETQPSPRVLDRLLDGRPPRPGAAPERSAAEEIQQGLLAPPRLAERPAVWWDAYVRTYVERDLRDLSQVHSLPDFRRVLELVALRSAQIVNESEIASSVAISQPTIHRWLNLLEVSQLIVRLPAFTARRGKRLMKRPKLHLVDPGLAAFLCGLHSPTAVRDGAEYGALFETLVVSQVRALASLLSPRAALHHWRTSDGKEVDLVVVHGRRLLAIGCKGSRRARSADARHLRLFKKLHPECKLGVLVYGGETIEDMGGGIVALPWTVLAGAASSPSKVG